MTTERIQKLLAQAGIGSRRTCEELITNRRVRVNGKIAQLGDQADPAVDTVTLDFQPVQIKSTKRYIMLNKPLGVICSNDPQGDRKTVYDLVPSKERLFCAGRLDVDSEGLVLLSNDGELTHELTHPSYTHEKEYHVLVRGRPDEEQLANWRRGLVLDEGERTGPCHIQVLDTSTNDTWLMVVMHEGKKRQIRRSGLAVGLPVKKLVRMRLASLRLGNLQTGQWRELTESELSELQASLQKQSKRRARRAFAPKTPRTPRTIAK
jgi:pseudouridine synthase